MDSNIKNAAGLLLFNAGYVYRLLRKNSEQLNVSWTQITLLKDIEMHAPITQKELAKINHMSGPSVSVATNKMIQQGFVKRTTNASDKRSSTLSLTLKGQQKLDKDGDKLQACLMPLLEQLSKSELNNLVKSELCLAKEFLR